MFKFDGESGVEPCYLAPRAKPVHCTAVQTFNFRLEHENINKKITSSELPAGSSAQRCRSEHQIIAIFKYTPKSLGDITHPLMIWHSD